MKTFYSLFCNHFTFYLSYLGMNYSNVIGFGRVELSLIKHAKRSTRYELSILRYELSVLCVELRCLIR